MTEEIEDAEVVGSELELRPHSPVNLFGAEEPAAIIEKASAHAKALADVINDRQLYSNISGKKYVRCEGWTLLGSMLGVFPVLEWSRPIEKGWMARVEARTLAGQIVGAAEAQCTRDERNWKNRDDYALQSMAQTRATAKALRIPLGFVMELAGYNVTPAEEIPFESGTEQRASSTSPSEAGRQAPSQPVAKSSGSASRKEPAKPKASTTSPLSSGAVEAPSGEVGGSADAASEGNSYELIAQAIADKRTTPTKVASTAMRVATSLHTSGDLAEMPTVSSRTLIDLPEIVLQRVVQDMNLQQTALTG